MRKTLLAALLLSGFVFFVSAQIIPNAGFENWTSTNFSDPSSYETTNNDAVKKYGQPANVTKITDAQHGSFAVKLETKLMNVDTVYGFMSIGSFKKRVVYGNQDEYPGGIPITGRPTALTGYYKCDIPAGDSAVIGVVFKKNGTVINPDWQDTPLRFGGSQSSYTQFTLPFDLSQDPDTVMIAIISSDALVFGGIPGSVLILDNLSFSGITTQPAQLNGDFEQWVEKTHNAIDNWFCEGDSILPTTDKYAGSYAAKLVTYSGEEDTSASIISLGWHDDTTLLGGVPFTNQTDTLCGWYKYIPAGNDTGMAWICLKKEGAEIHGDIKQLPPSSNYTYFEIPFHAPSAPDTAIVSFVSSHKYQHGNPGSALFIDNIRFKSEAVSIKNNPHSTYSSNLNLKVYQNPATGKARIEWGKQINHIAISIYDMTGRLLHRQQASGTYYILNFNDFAPGLYTVEVKTKDETRRVGLIHR